MISFFKSKSKTDNLFTIAFYNLENLFDTENDPNTLDDDFTPKGLKHWNYKRYHRKIKKLGSVISQIGTKKSNDAPAIVGVAEVENKTVLHDLVNSTYLKNEQYSFVHHDSPDERGIDVALLYKKELFEFISSETYPLFLEDENGNRDYTRDILLVTGNLKGELIHILVNHWPSRRSGDDITEEKRVKAAQLAYEISNKITSENKEAKIIIMGDFNDDPTSLSVKNYLVNDTFFNPMEKLLNDGYGTLSYDKIWHIFDQIMFSKNFINQTSTGLTFKFADVFDEHFLQEYKGKHKGEPFRTFIGKWYQGGFSDHFPVYVHLTSND